MRGLLPCESRACAAMCSSDALLMALRPSSVPGAVGGLAPDLQLQLSARRRGHAQSQQASGHGGAGAEGVSRALGTRCASRMQGGRRTVQSVQRVPYRGWGTGRERGSARVTLRALTPRRTSSGSASVARQHVLTGNSMPCQRVRRRLLDAAQARGASVNAS